MTARGVLPESCALAFKEWAGVCEALGRGDQILILRKGGISEGPAGFVPEHSVFWLYPTYLHETGQGLRVERSSSRPMPDTFENVEIGLLGSVDWVGFVEQESALAALEDLHVWTPETIAKRFHYRRPGLWVLGLSIYRLPRPQRIPVTDDHAGCKTWVPLDPPLSTSGVNPILEDEEFSRRITQLRSLLISE